MAKTPEGILLKTIRHILDILKNDRVLTYRRIQVSAIPIAGLKKFRKNTDMAGMNDIEVYLPYGRMLHLELKAPQGHLSDLQLRWQKELEGFGHKYVVIKSVADLIKSLSEAGIDHWIFNYEKRNSIFPSIHDDLR